MPSIPFTEAIKTVTPKIKINAKHFKNTGKYPIISQEASLVSGYWDVEDDVMRFVNPVVVFGDHTRNVKYIDFDFVVGADGLKIFQPNENLDAKYLYYWLLANPVESLGYSRHFRLLKDMTIHLRPLDEQKQIVAKLDMAFEKIDRANKLIDLNIVNANMLHVSVRKQEFIKCEIYEKKSISDIGINLDKKRKPITKSDRDAGSYPYYGASGIVDYVKDYIFDDTLLLISEDGANLVARSTPIAFTATGKFWVNNHAHIYKFDSPITHRYVEFAFENMDLKPYITGAAQPKLSQASLNKIFLPTPSEDIQSMVIEKIQYIKDASENLQRLYTSKRVLLDRLKHSMLNQAFPESSVK